MPTISAFGDHAPPHFRAIYGEFEATVGLEQLSVLEGRLHRRPIELVLDWAARIEPLR